MNLDSIVRSELSCTVIIPTRDQLDFLKPCVESVLATPFSGALDIIIVDNNSQDNATIDFLTHIQIDPRVTVISWEAPFNFSEINNMAAGKAKGEVLCFLNNDTRVISQDWLEKLSIMALQPDVGAVGALLLYPDYTVQHGGVAIDREQVAIHIATGMAFETIKRNYQLDMLYRVDAVTAACMLTRKSVFESLQGFDQDHLPVSFNDVDYCLRLEETGYLVMMYPDIQLFHFESISRKSDDLPQNRARARRELTVMRQKWKERLRHANHDGYLPWRKKTNHHPQQPLFRDTDTISAAVLAIKANQMSERRVSINSDWEQRYQSLQDYADHLENKIQVITSGKLWRIVTAIRSVLSPFYAARQKLGQLLGPRSVVILSGKQHVNSELAVSEPDQPTIEESKQKYSEEAAQILETFLYTNGELNLPCSNSPKVSIILVLYNQAPLTYLCLKSISDTVDTESEVIIIDNASSDLTSQLMKRINGAKFLMNTTNLGFVHAVNQGASMARGDYLLLLNNDAILHEGAITSALEVFDSGNDIGAVGGKIILLNGKLQEAGSGIWQDGNCFGYGRDDDPEKPEYMFRRDVDYCSGAFLMTPRAIFESLGGFDTDYAPAYYEESDYCVRLVKKGLRVVYDPRIMITHYEFASSSGFSDAVALQQQHRRIFCDKHAALLASKLLRQDANVLAARTAGGKKRLLFIDDRVPHAYLGAGYPRCKQILSELAKLPFNVTFYPLQTATDRWDATYATLAPDIEVMLGCGKEGLEPFLRKRTGFYDYIVVSRCINMEVFLEAMKHHPAILNNACLIYDAEALIAPREAARLRLEGKIVSTIKEKQMVESEIALARYADTIVAVSEAEANIYREAGCKKVVVLGHKLSINNAQDTSFASRQDILFVGALRDDNSPNVDSLFWFVENILPVIAKQLSEPVRLLIAGDYSAPSLKKLNLDQVTVLGRQPDLSGFYDRCRIFIAPTRFAAGIPHKVHEAAAYGIPSVTTSILAKQLGWSDEVELLIADDPKHFATQCIRLYTDEQLWNKIRETALGAVKRDCSPTRFSAQLANIFLPR